MCVPAVRCEITSLLAICRFDRPRATRSAICCSRAVNAGSAAPDSGSRRALDEVIDGLVDKSILMRVEERGLVRFRLLDTLGRYEREKLGCGDAEAALRARHANRYARLARGAADRYPFQIARGGRDPAEQLQRECHGAPPAVPDPDRSPDPARPTRRPRYRPDELLGRAPGEPALADTGDTGEGDQPVCGDQPFDVGQFPASPDEARPLRRQPTDSP
jgi:hypothetical protein